MPGNVTSSQRTTISLRVNGVERALEVEPRARCSTRCVRTWG